MFIKQIGDWVENNKEEILEFNKKLVSIPSVNRYPTGDELEVQLFIEKTLKELGCETKTFIPTDVPELTSHPAYLEGREYENRPNVVGVKKGTGGGRSILFSGHVDTVPEGDVPWSVDPYSGIIKDGKQYGLGIFDMKGGIAASILALKALSEIGVKLKGDLIIETVVDEEYGGANGTLANRLNGIEADIAIVPEPSNMVICPANQGGSMFRITFSGRSGRSYSGEELLNPVYAATRFIEIFRQYEKYQSEKIAQSSLFHNQGLPTLIQGMKAGPVDLPLCDRVPSYCSIDVWIQCYPETTEEQLREDFINFYKEKSKNDGILAKMPPKFEKLIRFLPGSGIDENHDFLKVAQQASVKVGEKLPIAGAPFACDLFMFNLYSDTPAIIWGPRGGNAHSNDEFIYVDDFLKLIKMYALTIIDWCGVEDK